MQHECQIHLERSKPEMAKMDSTVPGVGAVKRGLDARGRAGLIGAILCVFCLVPVSQGAAPPEPPSRTRLKQLIEGTEKFIAANEARGSGRSVKAERLEKEAMAILRKALPKGRRITFGADCPIGPVPFGRTLRAECIYFPTGWLHFQYFVEEKGISSARRFVEMLEDGGRFRGTFEVVEASTRVFSVSPGRGTFEGTEDRLEVFVKVVDLAKVPE